MNLSPISEISNASGQKDAFGTPFNRPGLICPQIHYKCPKQSTAKSTLASNSKQLRASPARISPFVHPHAEVIRTGPRRMAEPCPHNLPSIRDLNFSESKPNSIEIGKRSFDLFSQKCGELGRRLAARAHPPQVANLMKNEGNQETENKQNPDKILNLPRTRDSFGRLKEGDPRCAERLPEQAHAGTREKGAQDCAVLSDKRNALNMRKTLGAVRNEEAPPEKIKGAPDASGGVTDSKRDERNNPGQKSQNWLERHRIGSLIVKKRNTNKNKINFKLIQRKFQKSKMNQANKLNSIDLKSLNSPESPIFPNRLNNCIYYDLKRKCKYIRLTAGGDQPQTCIELSSLIPLGTHIQRQLEGFQDRPIHQILAQIDQVRSLILPLADLQHQLRKLGNYKRIKKNNLIKKIDLKKCKSSSKKPPKNESKSAEEGPKETRRDTAKSTNFLKSSQDTKCSQRTETISNPKCRQERKKPKKKRPSRQKGCNCNRSKCLRLHCVCFKNGLYCNENCRCQNCFNNVACAEIVDKVNRSTQEINPHAFEADVIEVPLGEEVVRVTKGCRCSKNFCLKNYCECRKKGLRCSSLCRCSDCRNSKIEIDPALASQLSKRKSRKKKKIVLTALNENALDISQVRFVKPSQSQRA